MGGIEGYRRLSKLGVGAFATTHLVQHDKTGKKLVMKRVACKHMRAANNALQEVKVLMSCVHESIVGYHDFFLDSDAMDNIVICLLMEFCDGGDLWELIASARREKRRVEAKVCTGWLLQLLQAIYPASPLCTPSQFYYPTSALPSATSDLPLQAMRYLNRQNILHRDIKPENIFITANGDSVKLGDFGLVLLQL